MILWVDSMWGRIKEGCLGGGGEEESNEGGR